MPEAQPHTPDLRLIDTNCSAPLFRANNIRQLEQQAISELGNNGSFILMQRAAAALLKLIQQKWPAPRKILVYAGSGNNGGDGYLLAAFARALGYDIRLYQHGDHTALPAAAQQAAAAAASAGVPLVNRFSEAELLIDALFGIGLNRSLDLPTRELIQSINKSGQPILAVDIPSGLESDSGLALPLSIKANCTVTFIGIKAGLLMQDGLDHCGQIWLSPLQLTTELNQLQAACTSLAVDDIKQLLPPRPANSHKGHFGHLLVIGGDHGFGGAAIMTAQTAVNCGAGLVSLFSRSEHTAVMLNRQPEVMASSNDCTELLKHASIIAIGPGLGQSSWGQALLEQVLQTDKTLLLDADALNLISKLTDSQQNQLKRNNWVLTPHPGEAARLLGCSSQEVQNDRLDAVTRLQQQFGGVVLLKGAGTLICNQNGKVVLLAKAHPALASGGMGDVLSGVIAALMAQGLSCNEACQLGAWLHFHAAKSLAEQQARPWLVATDLIRQLKLQLVN